MNFTHAWKCALAGATLVAAAGSASAVTIPLGPALLGSIVGGSGTATISPANSGIVTAFSFSGGFQFSSLYEPYFGFPTTPFQFQASSAGTQIYDTNGATQRAGNLGSATWQIQNRIQVGNSGTNLFESALRGPNFEFSMSVPTSSLTGTITGKLFHDGFYHWFWAHDNQTNVCPPTSAPVTIPGCFDGQIALPGKPYFTFTADYVVTNPQALGGQNPQVVQFRLENATISTVPTPATLALVGAGLLAMGAVRRRKAAAAA